MNSDFSRLFYRGTAAERAAFTPPRDGAYFWQTDTNSLWFYEAAWYNIGGGSSSYSVRIIVASPDTLGATDAVVVCNMSTALTVNLPAASGSGRWFSISNVNTGAVTIDGNGGDTINGEITQALYRWDSIQIVDYAAGAWVVI